MSTATHAEIRAKIARRKKVNAKTKAIMELTCPGFTSTSRAEEVISVLWLIAALIAHAMSKVDAIPFWFVVALYVKAASDTFCSILYAFREYRDARAKAERAVREEEGREP